MSRIPRHLFAVVGETDEAFAWLERGYRECDPQMISVQAEPRFNDLLRRIGFPES